MIWFGDNREFEEYTRAPEITFHVLLHTVICYRVPYGDMGGSLAYGEHAFYQASLNNYSSKNDFRAYKMLLRIDALTANGIIIYTN